MAGLRFPSPQTPEQLTRSIMTRCPGGAVGVVLNKQGRLLLPRRMTAKRVVIERRQPGMPSGRIVVAFSATASGSDVEISAGALPIAAAMSAAIVMVPAALVTRSFGAMAGAVVGVILVIIEALRWNKGLSGLNGDAAWLAEQLRQPASEGT